SLQREHARAIEDEEPRGREAYGWILAHRVVELEHGRWRVAAVGAGHEQMRRLGILIDVQKVSPVRQPDRIPDDALERQARWMAAAGHDHDSAVIRPRTEQNVAG